MIAKLLRGFEIRYTFSINLFCYLFIFFAFIRSLVVGSRWESETSGKVRVSWLSSDYGNRRCEFRFSQFAIFHISVLCWFLAMFSSFYWIVGVLTDIIWYQNKIRKFILKIFWVSKLKGSVISDFIYGLPCVSKLKMQGNSEPRDI